ncbi:hypothetical protein [Geomicrobium sp. JCM 19055]|uniref:hypothetical protein n=1 Tax=Geomicrobium sp. JCM 19055 TaxID=1460649 RepID=UPI00045ED2B6|nr:hypothetical protein [Geomicrobium sp. JCM 19055]GAJ99433.1 hypothetical protein JCM19055_2433 [Geomicrobium sp. JCM 19055]
MPKKKKNGVWNTINHYLFGNDPKKNDEETVEPKRQERASYGRQDKRNDDASRAKVFHKYPKEGTFDSLYMLTKDKNQIRRNELNL